MLSFIAFIFLTGKTGDDHKIIYEFTQMQRHTLIKLTRNYILFICSLCLGTRTIIKANI